MLGNHYDYTGVFPPAYPTFPTYPTYPNPGPPCPACGCCPLCGRKITYPWIVYCAATDETVSSSANNHSSCVCQA